MGTDDDFAAEQYRQDRRRARGWCPFIVVGLLVLAVTSFRLAGAVTDRIFR